MLSFSKLLPDSGPWSNSSQICFLTVFNHFEKCPQSKHCLFLVCKKSVSLLFAWPSPSHCAKSHRPFEGLQTKSQMWQKPKLNPMFERGSAQDLWLNPLSTEANEASPWRVIMPHIHLSMAIISTIACVVDPEQNMFQSHAMVNKMQPLCHMGTRVTSSVMMLCCSPEQPSLSSVNWCLLVPWHWGVSVQGAIHEHESRIPGWGDQPWPCPPNGVLHDQQITCEKADKNVSFRTFCSNLFTFGHRKNAGSQACGLPELWLVSFNGKRMRCCEWGINQAKKQNWNICTSFHVLMLIEAKAMSEVNMKLCQTCQQTITSIGFLSFWPQCHAPICPQFGHT